MRITFSWVAYALLLSFSLPTVAKSDTDYLAATGLLRRGCSFRTNCLVS